LRLGGVYLYGAWADRPASQTKFGEISLAATPADVLFVKGEPKLKEGPELWLYNAGTGSAAHDAAQYLVRFKDGQLRFVLYTARAEQIVNPSLMGFDIGASYDEVTKRLGQPSRISISENQLDRMISYENYNTFFSFNRGKIVAYGMYQPKSGPMAFRSEAAPPSSAK
jgi:hypothetical protein